MKFIRRLLTCLLVVTVVVAIMVAAAFVPVVQTWAAQAALSERSGLHASLGSLWAGLGFVDVSDLKLEPHGAVLTMPSLEARFPLAAAAARRKFLVRSLVAKGWTLDLSHISGESPSPAAAPVPEAGASAAPQLSADVAPAQRAIQAVGALLGGWKLPGDMSLDGVDLEGDVLFPGPKGEEPGRMHVAVTGGGMAQGHEGVFEIDAEVHDARLPTSPYYVHGNVYLTMDSPRTISRIGAKVDLSDEEGSRHKQLPFSADVAASRTAGGDDGTLDLSRGGRHVATVVVHFTQATNQLAGTWKTDLRDADLAPLAPDHPLPSFSASGGGDFDADAGLKRVHATGRLNSIATRLGVLEPRLERLGAVTLDSRFDLARTGHSIRVDHLGVSVAGAAPVAEVRFLQAFDVDEKTGGVGLVEPGADLMEATFPGLPLAWLSALTGRFAFAGGDATGGFILRATEGGFTLRSKAPFTATGVSVTAAGRTLGQGLDLSVPLSAAWSAKGWQMQASPISVSSAGRKVATIEAKATQAAGADQPVAVTGTWSADLDALASGLGGADTRWIAGSTASGEFTANAGASTVVDAKLAVKGHDPGHSIDATVHADLDDDGGVSFLVPVKIAFGSGASEVSAKGTWNGDTVGGGIDVRLTSDHADLAHLRFLGAPVAAAMGIRMPASSANAGGGSPAIPRARDRTPFWGDWAGHVQVSFAKLKIGASEFDDVGGALYIRKGFIQLIGGRWMLPHLNIPKLDGQLDFNAAAESPYRLKVIADLNEIDAAPLFPAPKTEKQPGLEGHFAVAGTITGEGSSLDDLVSRTREEFHLSSKGGVIRLLNTSVAEAIPEGSSPVADTLDTVGSAVGSLLGHKGLAKGKNPVSKNADAVISFTYDLAEIAYDQILVTAVRDSDGTIRLSQITMEAPDEHVTGSGQIAYVAGQAISARPLSAELQFALRGRAAELLSQTILLSQKKDDLGYTLLKEAVHLGGTVEQIDLNGWHDLLVKAALQKPAGK